MTVKEIPEQFWQVMQQHLGYTDEELALFKKNPRNARVLQTAPDMRRKTIVFEVVESQGCNSQHQVGTRFFFTGDGNMITSWGPPRVCIYAMPVMSQAIFGMQELWYAGVDPNELTFRRASCFDVGIRCGGWGRIVLEAKVIPRDEARALAKSHSVLPKPGT